MTNMELIDQIVKEGGIHYGHTVERNPEKYGTEKMQELRSQRKCKECGEYFTPGLRSDGKPSERAKCNKCIEKRRAEIEADKARRAAKRRKEYIRECSKCGTEVKTTQAPRSKVPIYCKTCRKSIKKGERMVKYGEVDI